ncbi:hypothetical protein POG22_16855 [Geitlerinema sp. CS-897]|nr:hypothetical protein [Geitlerinema sp. CS-897]
MDLTQKTLQALLSNSLCIDCAHIELRQQVDENPVVYSGSGSIYQKNDGCFYFKLYHLYNSNENFIRDLQRINRQPKPGTIIKKQEYFKLEARDMSGNYWHSENISVSTKISFGSSIMGKVIDEKLKYVFQKRVFDNSECQNQENLLIFCWKWYCQTQNNRSFKAEALSLWCITLTYYLISRRTNQGIVRAIIPGKYKIPCNKKTELPNQGWKWNVCSFVINETKIEVLLIFWWKWYCQTQNDRYLKTETLNLWFIILAYHLISRRTKIELTAEENYLKLIIFAPEEAINKEFEDKIIEALSIVFGRICYRIYSSLQKNGVIDTTLSSVESSTTNHPLPCPIRHESLHSFETFIRSYIYNFESSNGDFFNYWYKINRAWQGGFENAALVASISVEGVLISYYHEFGMPDSDILEQAQKAKEVIQKHPDIKERVRRRLESSLGNLEDFSPRTALIELKKQGKIEKKLVDNWNSLRSQVAHGYKLDEDLDKVQRYVNKFYKCIVLFYILLFLKINFDKKYINYSKDGWPDNQLDFNQFKKTKG